MFTTILNKVSSILEANTLIQEVFKYEAEQFNGDPVAIVIPSSNESDYDTTEENIRIYAYTVRLFVNRTTRTKEKADEVLRDLVDSIIDDLDVDYTFTGIVNATGYTFINTFAMPSLWGYSGNEAEYRVAEIDVRCRVSVNLNLIS